MKSALAATLVSALVLATGCSSDAPPDIPPPPAPGGLSAAPAYPTAPSEPLPEESTAPNDLDVSPLRRTFTSSGLTVTVQYSASPSVDNWTPNGSESLRVFLTVVNKKKPKQKIYLTRASVRFSLRDADGEIPGPDPVVDTSGLDPGYLVTSPYSYNQSFPIPPLDGDTEAMTLDFKFETVTLVDRKAKDYTKQVSTNTVRVALGF